MTRCHVAARAAAAVALPAMATLAGVALALAAPEPGPSAAEQAGSPAVSIELVGALKLGGGIHADVWGHRDIAYVGTWSGGCPGTGVKLIDLSDPANPTLIGTVAEHAGTSAEDVEVIAASTSAFQGDLLVVGLQACRPGGLAGAEFWDVSDPRHPRALGFLPTPGTGGVHELHLFQRGDRVVALLAVPHSESAGAGGDLRIVDASDPRNPLQVADWGAAAALGLGNDVARGQFPDVFAHSAWASPDGNTAYVSYWDAGVIVLDISDLGAPRYLGRTTYSGSDEGNAHSSAVTRDGRVLVQADEDLSVTSTAVQVDGPETVSGRYEVVEASFGLPLARSDTLSGELVYVGRGCPGGGAPTGAAIEDPLLADPAGRIALVDRGECLFFSKVSRLAEAGALAVIVANNVDGGMVRMGGGGPASIPIPAVMLDRATAQRLKQAAAEGPVRVSLGKGIGARYNDWGYLRFWDISNPAAPVQIGTYATPSARPDPDAGPPDDGHYTVHNPFVVGDRLYASWFSDGLRVLDISDPSRPREVASFVPPAHPDPSGGRFNPDRPMVWGVYPLGDLVLLSDMNYGLYVLRVSEAAGTR